MAWGFKVHQWTFTYWLRSPGSMIFRAEKAKVNTICISQQLKALGPESCYRISVKKASYPQGTDPPGQLLRSKKELLPGQSPRGWVLWKKLSKGMVVS